MPLTREEAVVGARVEYRNDKDSFYINNGRYVTGVITTVEVTGRYTYAHVEWEDQEETVDHNIDCDELYLTRPTLKDYLLRNVPIKLEDIVK